MTLERATPKGKVGGGEANGKTKVGPCWRSFIQSKLSRGSHTPGGVRNAKSRNITPGIRPSLPPFTKYIDALII